MSKNRTGIALLLIGLVVMFAPLPARLGIINVDSVVPAIGASIGSTDPNAPLDISPLVDPINFWIKAWDTDDSGGQRALGYVDFAIYVVDSGVVALSQRQMVHDPPLDDALSWPPYIAEYWSYQVTGADLAVIPTATKLRVHFWVYDDPEPRLLTERDTYFQRGYPTADFYINGQKFTDSSTIRLNTKTMNFRAVPTAEPGLIAGVTVSIWIGTVPPVPKLTDVVLVKQVSGDYTGSYVLSSDGTYTLRAIMRTTGGAYVALAVITAQVETDGVPGAGDVPARSIGLWQITGVLMLVFGGVILVAGKNGRRGERA